MSMSKAAIARRLTELGHQLSVNTLRSWNRERLEAEVSAYEAASVEIGAAIVQHNAEAYAYAALPPTTVLEPVVYAPDPACVPVLAPVPPTVPVAEPATVSSAVSKRPLTWSQLIGAPFL